MPGAQAGMLAPNITPEQVQHAYQVSVHIAVLPQRRHH